MKIIAKTIVPKRNYINIILTKIPIICMLDLVTWILITIQKKKTTVETLKEENYKGEELNFQIPRQTRK